MRQGCFCESLIELSGIEPQYSASNERYRRQYNGIEFHKGQGIRGTPEPEIDTAGFWRKASLPHPNNEVFAETIVLFKEKLSEDD